MNKSKFQKLKIYSLSIAIALSVGIFSALLTRDNMDIYSSLAAPPLSPPSWLFPVVWTALYILMGISGAKIYLQRENVSRKIFTDALGFYTLSLAFNFAWSIIFFNSRAFLFAFVWLIILLYLIIRTILTYAKIDTKAAKLQIPYALWVTFAGYLNLGIYLLNR